MGIPYSAAFLSDFKAAVRVRAYDPKTKTWWIQESAVELVERLLADNGIENEPLVQRSEVRGNGHKRVTDTGPGWKGEPWQRVIASHLNLEAYGLLGVRKDADDAVVRAAYRALAKKHHPDAGGDSEAMKRLNLAWEKIQKERGL